MNAPQERLVRSWLAARDPGGAPARLRSAAAQVADAGPSSLAAKLDAAAWRVVGTARWTRLFVILVVALVVTLAVAGAIVYHPWDPFPPRGLIAYTISLEQTGSSGIRLIAADGTGERQISPALPNLFDHSPRWSSDGRTLLFARNTGLDPFGSCPGVGSVVLYDVATRTERVVATDLRPIGMVEWSPAGDRVAFTYPPPGCGAPVELGVVDLASGEVTTTKLGDGRWRLRWTNGDVSAVAVAFDPDAEIVVAESPSHDEAFFARTTAPRFGGPSHLEIVN